MYMCLFSRRLDATRDAGERACARASPCTRARKHMPAQVCVHVCWYIRT